MTHFQLQSYVNNESLIYTSFSQFNSMSKLHNKFRRFYYVNDQIPKKNSFKSERLGRIYFKKELISISSYMMPY